MRGLRAGSARATTSGRRAAAWRWATAALLIFVGAGLASEASRAQPRTGVEMQDERPRDPMPIFDRDEVDEMERQRAEALRRNLEIEQDLRRMQTNHTLERMGRTNWNLWY